MNGPNVKTKFQNGIHQQANLITKIPQKSPVCKNDNIAYTVLRLKIFGLMLLSKKKKMHLFYASILSVSGDSQTLLSAFNSHDLHPSGLSYKKGKAN